MAQSGIPFVAPYKRGEDFDRWIRGLDYYFAASKISNADQKKATLLHVLGMEIQDVFETLKPVQSEGTPLDAYKEACQRLHRYYQPKTNKVFERYRFHEMKQGEETMEQFVSRLQVQASKCGFSQTEVESHICDQ